jgi:hypothetical protein
MGKPTMLPSRKLALCTGIGLVLTLGGLYSTKWWGQQPLQGVGEQAAEAAKPVQPDAWWKERALAAEEQGRMDVAADYRARIEAFRLSQEPAAADGGKAVPPLAASSLYVAKPLPERKAPLALHEPVHGTYLGMLGADRRVGYDTSRIEGVYGRKHAMYLSYVGWRKFQADTQTYFPKRTADRVKELGGSLQIGWEPRYGLDDVKDDEYVRTFAKEAKASGIPVFLRYASEMNGAWVPWYGDPKKYIEKFRLVHDIMAEEAPNVAMVWSPNFLPANNIDEYYPGDAYVDWVGFSLYATPLTGGKEHLDYNVIDYFEPLYRKYSHKPIMISEGAVAHTVLEGEKAYEIWAEGQLGYMYGLLPRMFPQVKAILYFNFSRAQAVRSKMEYVYDLGENLYLDGKYRRLIGSDWFLSQVEQGGSSPVSYTYDRLAAASLPAGKHKIMAYAKPEGTEWPFAVAVYQGDRRLGISYEMPWEMDIEVAPGQANAEWRIVAYNRSMEPMGSGTYQP